MNGFMMVLMAIAMFAVLASLGIGLAVMIRGGELNKNYGNKLMRARVLLQGVAVALLVVAFIGSRG